MSINSVTLLGNVGGDPEIRSSNNGDRIATFSLATGEVWKDKTTGEKKETTDWHRIVVFNQKLVDIIDQYVRKGSKVGIVNGSVKTRKYTDKDGADRYTTEIVIGRFRGELTLEGSPKGVERDEHGYGSTTTRSSEGKPGDSAPLREQLDDDIPF